MKHGQYLLEGKKEGEYALFNTYLKKGRIFLRGGKVVEISPEKDMKLIKTIITKGERIINPFGEQKKERRSENGRKKSERG